MDTRRTAEFWNSDEGQSFLATHLPVVYHLDRISNWSVFGTITFETPSLRSSTDLSQIHRQLHGLLNGLAARFKVRTRNLVFFYSVEGDGVVRHRHAHILLAQDRLENSTPDQLSQTLTELADRYGIGNCRFIPFDPRKDGVAYAAKLDTVAGDDGRSIPVEPHYRLSIGLSRRINEEQNSIWDTVGDSAPVSESSGADQPHGVLLTSEDGEGLVWRLLGQLIEREIQEMVSEGLTADEVDRRLDYLRGRVDRHRKEIARVELQLKTHREHERRRKELERQNRQGRSEQVTEKTVERRCRDP